ncbi:hypothetical protein KW799_02225 [Candidatus Parcubacteria bacterium]|nr:hypothetical protein [Candidatus Parcubacteria bacterium]
MSNAASAIAQPKSDSVFKFVGFEGSPEAIVNYQERPIDIAKRLSIVVEHEAFRREPIARRRSTSRGVRFEGVALDEACRDLRISVNYPFLSRVLFPDAERREAACVRELITSQACSSCALDPKSEDEERRIIAPGSAYEVNEDGIRYPYLYVREGSVVLGFIKPTAFALKPSDIILVVCPR